MSGIGIHCHELRVRDDRIDWRIVYRLDEDAVIVVAVFEKRTQRTPKIMVDLCRVRLRKFDAVAEDKER